MAASLSYNVIKVLAEKAYKYRRAKRKLMDSARNIKKSKHGDYRKEIQGRIDAHDAKGVAFGVGKSGLTPDSSAAIRAFNEAKKREIKKRVRKARASHQKAREFKDIVKKSDYSLNQLQDRARAISGERTRRQRATAKAHRKGRRHKQGSEHSSWGN